MLPPVISYQQANLSEMRINQRLGNAKVSGGPPSGDGPSYINNNQEYLRQSTDLVVHGRDQSDHSGDNNMKMKKNSTYKLLSEAFNN